MKIRTGFVSNSSSSSFVFALPDKPKDAEELRLMLWDDVAVVTTKIGTTFSTHMAADVLFQNLMPCSKRALAEEFSDAYGDSAVLAAIKAEFTAAARGQYIFSVTLSDHEAGEESLEWGGLGDTKVKVLKFSHH